MISTPTPDRLKDWKHGRPRSDDGLMAAVCEEKLAEIFSFKIQGGREFVSRTNMLVLSHKSYRATIFDILNWKYADIAGPKFLIKFFSLLDHHLLALFQIYSSIQAQPPQ